ncbi:MAG: hypothetical protein IIZ28_02485 [Erysipelotrichaceae bacterium]|nr:hypothetical protein [Erysipelotrichaceae bacterium]
MSEKLDSKDLSAASGGTFTAGIYTCPECGSRQIDVIKNFDPSGSIKEAYHCTSCGHSWHDKDYFNND